MFIKFQSIFFAALTAGFIFAQPTTSTRAELVVVTPHVDGWGEDRIPIDGKIDRVDSVANNRQAGVFIGTGTPDSVRRSTFEFFIGGIGVDQRITSALFQIEGFQSFGSLSNDIAMHGYDGDGVLRAADLELENLLETRRVTEHNFVELFDVTDFVSNLHQTDRDFVGFQFRIADESLFNHGVDFIGTQWPGGGDPPDSSRFPRLFIQTQTVPEPNALLLLVAGCLGIFSSRKTCR